MCVIAEKCGQMRCDMTAQVMATPIAWRQFSKLTSEEPAVITNVSLVDFRLK